MIEEFKTMYTIHRWMRCITWMGLLCSALFLLWAAGGFPPRAWGMLALLLAEAPAMWREHGPIVLVGILALALLSAAWLLAWCLVIGLGLRLLWRHHGRQGGWAYLWRVRRARRKLQQVMQAMDWKASREHERLPAGPLARTLSPSFALSTDYVLMDISAPRLRLPQKQRQHTPSPAQPLEQVNSAWQDTQPVLAPLRPATTGQLTRAVSLPTTGALAIQDIPTVPESLATEDTLPHTRSRASRPIPTLHMEVGVGRHLGIARKRPNEDSLVTLQGIYTYQERLLPFGLFVVADGMGGHSFGQEAGRIAVQQMAQHVLLQMMQGNSLDDNFFTDLLVAAVLQANEAVQRASQERGQHMGTTVTAALVVASKAYIVNVGDSRTYRYDPHGGLLQITRDHSLVATLVEAGAITPDEVYTHPDRNKVYRCLGADGGIDVDWFVCELRADDILLLCSDGLWEMVRDRAIERILRRHVDPNTMSDELVEAALRGGGRDNISAIVVKML